MADQKQVMIEFRNVRKRLGGREILKGISFSNSLIFLFNSYSFKGETIALVGGSGTGKSVTLKHMVGLLKPDSGDIIIDGLSWLETPSSQVSRIRRKFGVLFQSGALLNWMTVEQNVGLPLYEHTQLGDGEIKERVARALELVGLTGSENKYPSEISGGMKKRAGLARAIILEPEILLYDEPTSGLDPVMSRHVDQLIMDLQRKLQVTSVVVTHDLHSAFTIADRIIMLHRGEVVEIAEPQQFAKSQNPLVREFVDAQFITGKVEELS